MSTSTPTAAATPTPIPFELQYSVKYKVEVVDVVDGDTIDIILPDGSKERVRMLGVDTPETTAEKNKPNEYDGITDLECLAYWGIQAKNFAKSMLEGKYAYIEFDSTAGFRGYYGRLLAYVYTENGQDFTAELIKQGYARVYEEGECQKESEYLSYQNSAMNGNLGLWICRVLATPTPTQTLQNCDDAYPTVCIPPPPPDLDCGDIPYRNFQVLPPDPHKFDRDKDGIGCES
jgi:micrococcal nuclease